MSSFFFVEVDATSDVLVVVVAGRVVARRSLGAKATTIVDGTAIETMATTV